MGIFSVLFRYRDKKSPDILGLYPEKCHIKAFPERRYLWTARLLAIWSAISLSLTIILTFTVYLLLPLRGGEPQLVEKHFGELRYSVPQTVSVAPGQLLTENYIREYVKLRHTLPESLGQLQSRWSEDSLFRIYSDEDVYNKFKSNLDMNEVKKYIINKVKRSVKIEKVQRQRSNLYIVYFKTFTTIPEKTETDISLWKAYLRIAYLTFDEKNPPSEYLKNPFGFKVISYEYGYAGKNKEFD